MAYQLAEALQDDASGLGISQGLLAVALAATLGCVPHQIDALPAETHTTHNKIPLHYALATSSMRGVILSC